MGLKAGSRPDSRCCGIWSTGVCEEAGRFLGIRLDGRAEGVLPLSVNMTETSAMATISERPRQADERLIRLTPAAGEKALKLIARDQQGEFLRVGISGGGCNGLTYRMKFVTEAKKGDILVQSAGVDVLVDSKSALYLKGTVLDYSDKMVGGGFKFSNPNAKASCSCGESFSL